MSTLYYGLRTITQSACNCLNFAATVGTRALGQGRIDAPTGGASYPAAVPNRLYGMDTNTNATQSNHPAHLPPSREHARLEVFLGSWMAEGRLSDGATVTLTLECEWLPGAQGYFLQQREHMHWADGVFCTTRIIGYDRDAGSYSVQHFDSFGYGRSYQASEHDGVWALLGEAERATYAFSRDAATFSARWEQRSAGRLDWQLLCELNAVKVR